MSFEATLPALAEYLGKKVVDRLFTPRALLSESTKPAERLQKALVDHLLRVANWSSQDRILRMPTAKETQAATVPLSFARTIRKYRIRDASNTIIGEQDLLNSNQHLLILGPPGAGKTTTLKRLAQTLLTNSPLGDLDTFQTPLVLRLRELDLEVHSFNPLLVIIGQELGLSIAKLDPPPPRTITDGSGNSVIEQKPGLVTCEGEPIGTSLPRILNELRPVILIDGLDEISSAARGPVEEDIEILLEGCRSYKIIATCRSGEYSKPLGYMNTLEVCSLEPDDIRFLSQIWLPTRHEEFLTKIQSPSLSELSQRPLFLTHLLAIFDEDGELPEQPYEVYEQVVMLMLREWDRERGINRGSRYADFGPKRKLKFLAALAYKLTYESKLKVFAKRDLISIYDDIRSSFGLPADEAELCATELESHTGLICEAGGHRYEFSHLSVQEYLCAQHLVTSPFPQDSIPGFLRSYPAPLAIATALSADPAGWLAGIILHDSFADWTGAEESAAAVDAFLSRLESENPSFANHDAIGICMLILCFRAEAMQIGNTRNRILEYLNALTKNVLAKDAFCRALKKYYELFRTGWRGKTLVARMRKGIRSASVNSIYSDLHLAAALPAEAKLPKDWLEMHFASDLLPARSSA